MPATQTTPKKRRSSQASSNSTYSKKGHVGSNSNRGASFYYAFRKLCVSRGSDNEYEDFSEPNKETDENLDEETSDNEFQPNVYENHFDSPI